MIKNMMLKIVNNILKKYIAQQNISSKFRGNDKIAR